MTQLSPAPIESKRPTAPTPSRSVADEMPDPDNLRVDRTDLITLPMRLSPAPPIGERLAPARHRAEYTRSA